MAVPVRQRGFRPIGTRIGGVTYGNQFAQAQVFWNDDWLKRAGVQAFVRAGRDAGKVARAKSPSSRVARSISTNFYSGGAKTGMNIAGIIRARNPLSHLFELGVKPHTIAPKGSLAGLIALGRSRTKSTASGHKKGVSSRGKRIAMKFPDGGFSRGTVDHPGMEAKPFLRPAAAAFPEIYRRALSRFLRY